MSSQGYSARRQAKAPDVILRYTQGQPSKPETTRKETERSEQFVLLLQDGGAWGELKRKTNSREYSIMRIIK